MPTDRPGPEGVYGKVVISVHPRMKVDSKHRDVGFLALSGHCTVTSLTTAYSHKRSCQDFLFHRNLVPYSWTAAISFAAMTSSDSEASGPPGRGAKPCECRGVPSHHEIGGAPAVQSQNQPTNPGDRHAMSRPGPESPSTAKRATVFGQLEVLSGKSRLRSSDLGNFAGPPVNITRSNCHF